MHVRGATVAVAIRNKVRRIRLVTLAPRVGSLSHTGSRSTPDLQPRVKIPDSRHFRSSPDPQAPASEQV